MEYFFILCALALATGLIHWRLRLRLFHNKAHTWLTISVLFAIGVAWDTLAISRGHWLFPSSHNLGIIIGKMPIEEYLFMLIQPYFVLVVYRAIEKKILKNPPV